MIKDILCALLEILCMIGDYCMLTLVFSSILFYLTNSSLSYIPFMISSIGLIISSLINIINLAIPSYRQKDIQKDRQK